MSKTADLSPKSTLSRVVDLLVEHEIRLDALEQVLKDTDPLIHEVYLGKIEKLRVRKATEVAQVLTQTLGSQPSKR